MAPLIGIAIELATRFGPGLVGMLKGPKAEETAQKVVDAARTVTGKDKPEEALEALREDPALSHAYRMRLVDVQLEHAKLESAERADERRADNENIQGARMRDVDMRKLTGGVNVRSDSMVWVAALGLAATGVAILWLTWVAYGASADGGKIAPIDAAVFSAVLTQLANIAARFAEAMMSAYQFEFGSSRSSRIMAESNAITNVVKARRDG